MAELPQFFNLTSGGRKIGLCRQTMAKRCRDNPGFGLLIDDVWRIPRRHIARLRKGEGFAEIAANPSLPRDDDGEEPRAA
jgi:hypothetical protein